MLICIETNHCCLALCSILIEMYQFRVKLFFNLHLLRRRKALNDCLIIDLTFFPSFLRVFFLFRLYIHILFTFYSSPQVKVNMIYMSKKKRNITRINFLSLGELCWNHRRVKSRNELYVSSLMSRLTLKWDKCLEKLKICKLHQINCFSKRFVIRSSAKNLGICASRAFLRSYEITDLGKEKVP